MAWRPLVLVLVGVGAFAPARDVRVGLGGLRRHAGEGGADEDWRRLASSKDGAVDVFLEWAMCDASFGSCLRTVNLRRGRFGGDVGPALWPEALRRRLGPGLAKRDAARRARRVVWAEHSTSESLRLSWTALQAAYRERERVVRHVNAAAEESAPGQDLVGRERGFARSPRARERERERARRKGRGRELRLVGA